MVEGYEVQFSSTTVLARFTSFKESGNVDSLETGLEPKALNRDVGLLLSVYWRTVVLLISSALKG